MSESFLNDKVILHCGDCMEVLATLEPDSIDACVTDPPYHLTSIVKRFGAENAAPAKGGVYNRASRGFMGKQWDGGEIAFEPETWAAVMRVLKPGGHLLAFGAPKNFGFMQYAIAQSGFEIRDVIAWLFGSGFPKSHNAGNGWGTALKPAYEPVIMARKPLIGTVAENVTQFGTGAINVDGCRVGVGEPRQSLTGGMARKASPVYGSFANETIETITTTEGRWPANVIHDGSDEVVGAFPGDCPGAGDYHSDKVGTGNGVTYMPTKPHGTLYADQGSAARFFYSAKADADDRLGSKHPTVKPLDLMQYLVRLVTPPGGTVLDLFAGTGTTGEAAWREGFRAVLIEREAEYQADIRRRMAHALAGPDERKRAIAKAKHGDEPFTEGLFA
jgi:site-specific DNA-methyltransferase (adenine-specific)